MKKKQKEEYTITRIPLVLLCVRKKAQRSTTQHRSAGQGTAPQRTAEDGAALCCWATGGLI